MTILYFLIILYNSCLCVKKYGIVIAYISIEKSIGKVRWSNVNERLEEIENECDGMY